MKKMMLCCIAMTVTISLWAETEQVNGYTWTYRNNGDSVEIYGNPYVVAYAPCISPMPKGFVKIPVSLGGNPVTVIGESAFRGCEEMTGASIPPGVTSIEDGAFQWCSKLRNVTIPNGVTSIGDDAFECCYELKRIIIPNGVINIGKDAFRNCRLVGVTIPQSVVGIGDGAFDCNTLRGVIMPKRFKSKSEIARIFCRYNNYNFNISCPDEHEVIIKHKDDEVTGRQNWYGW